MPRSSPEQFAVSHLVHPGDEQPSDLIFFSVEKSGPSHVGIYLGKGKFVHAPGSGDVVKISDANSKYWHKRFIGIHRWLE